MSYCIKCGHLAYTGLQKVECTNETCENYSGTIFDHRSIIDDSCPIDAIVDAVKNATREYISRGLLIDEKTSITMNPLEDSLWHPMCRCYIDIDDRISSEFHDAFFKSMFNEKLPFRCYIDIDD